MEKEFNIEAIPFSKYHEYKGIYKVEFTDLASNLTDLVVAKNEKQAIKKIKRKWGNTSCLIKNVEPYRREL